MKKIVLIILTFVSLQVTAGISSIGNGGGLGELQFIYYFDNTDQIIAICERSPTCQLSSEQNVSWHQLKMQQLEFKNKVNISFVPSVANSWAWSNKILSISQKWLYQNNSDLLRSDAEIMIFALAIQLSHTQNLDFEATYEQTAKSLSGLSFYNQSSASISNAFHFHWITLSNSVSGTDCLKLFILEDSISSYSLNTLIQEKSKYININSLELYNVLVRTSDLEITVYGSVSGSSGDTYFNQRPFKFTASINEHNLIVKESIQLFLFLE